MWNWLVSIHAPRVGRDPVRKCIRGLFKFQFTRPAWGATEMFSAMRRRFEVSIHAPRVGRDPGEEYSETCSSVSIHAPRVGRDKATKPTR